MAGVTPLAAIRIVGCGRWSMGDDQAGLVVAQRLAGTLGSEIDVIAGEDPIDLLTDPDVATADLLIIVDAAAGDDAHPAGTLARVTCDADTVASKLGRGLDTHSLGVGEALALAASLQNLPGEIWIYAIFGKCFERSGQLSPVVARAVDELAARITRDLLARRTGELRFNDK